MSSCRHRCLKCTKAALAIVVLDVISTADICSQAVEMLKVIECFLLVTTEVESKHGTILFLKEQLEF